MSSTKYHFPFLKTALPVTCSFSTKLKPLFEGRSGPGESQGAGQRLDVAEVLKYFNKNMTNIFQNDDTNCFGSRLSRVRGGQARATIAQAGYQVQGKTLSFTGIPPYPNLYFIHWFARLASAGHGFLAEVRPSDVSDLS